MKLLQREREIMDILSKRKTAKTQYLCKQLFCSEATIRRSLVKLEQAGLIKRFHGGATLIPDKNIEYPHFYREKKRQKEKTYISDLAFDFIGNGDTLFLDSSSTVATLCTKLDHFKNLTVITNGLQIALMLSKFNNIDVYIAGGIVKKSSLSVIGQLSSQFIGDFTVDLAFISCRGMDKCGIYEADPNQALTKKHMIDNANQTILLSDHTKMNHQHLYKLTDFNQIDAFITNQKPDDLLLTSIQNKGCEVVF